MRRLLSLLVAVGLLLSSAGCLWVVRDDGHGGGRGGHDGGRGGGSRGGGSGRH